MTHIPSSRKILICDDEEGIRESLKLILSDDYDLIVVDSSTQCVDVLKQDKSIAILLLDIKMPKMHGLEVVKEVQKVRPDVKIIMVTGYRSVETAAESIKLGAVDYIVKPFKSDEILNSVKKFFPGEKKKK